MEPNPRSKIQAKTICIKTYPTHETSLLKNELKTQIAYGWTQPNT